VERFAPAPPQTFDPPGTMIYNLRTTGRRRRTPQAAPPEQALATTQLLMRGFGLAGNPGDIVTVVTADVSFIRAECLRQCCGAARRQCDPAAAIRSGGTFGADRARSRHPPAHGAIMFNRLLRLPDDVRSRYDLSSLKFVIHAAAPVSPPIKRAHDRMVGPCHQRILRIDRNAMVTLCTAQEWLAHPGRRPHPARHRFADRRAGRRDHCRPVRSARSSPAPAPSPISPITATTRSAAIREGRLFDPRHRLSRCRRFLYLCDRAKDMVILRRRPTSIRRDRGRAGTDARRGRLRGVFAFPTRSMARRCAPWCSRSRRSARRQRCPCLPARTDGRLQGAETWSSPRVAARRFGKIFKRKLPRSVLGECGAADLSFARGSARV